MKNTEKTMEKIVALCKGRGFIFAGSEIYGGLANPCARAGASSSPAARSTAALPTPGTTAPWAWS